MPAYGLERGRINSEPEASSKAYRAQQAQLVLAEAAIRFADRPDDPSPQIGMPTHVIEHLARVVPHQQPVYREVAPLHVLLRSTRVHHAIRMPPIGIADIGAERRHLNLQPIALYGNDAELRARSRLPAALHAHGCAEFRKLNWPAPAASLLDYATPHALWLLEPPAQIR